MWCYNCGKELDEGTNFCTQCGVNLYTTPPPQIISQYSPNEPHNSYLSNTPYPYHQNTHNKKKTGRIVFLSFLFVLLVGTLIFFLLPGSKLVGTWVVVNDDVEDSWQMTISFTLDNRVILSKEFNGILVYDYGSHFWSERTGELKIVKTGNGFVEGKFRTPENNFGYFKFKLDLNEDKLYIETHESEVRSVDSSDIQMLECDRM